MDDLDDKALDAAHPEGKGRASVLEEAARVAEADQGLHVTTELVHGIRQGDPEREFWRGYTAAKESIAAAIRALAASPTQGGQDDR